MKTTIRIFLAGAVVLVMLLVAWNGVFAEKGSSSAGQPNSLRNLLAPLFSAKVQSSEAQTELPEATETPQVMENHPGQDDAAAEMTGAPETNETDQGEDHAMETPETHDDNQGQGQAAGIPEAHAGELSGIVTAINGTSVTIDGQVFQLASNAEGLDGVKVGDTVKIELETNSDGSVSVREIQVGEQSGNSGDSSQSGSDSSGDQQNGSGSDSGSGSHDGGSGGGGHGGSGDGGGG